MPAKEVAKISPGQSTADNSSQPSQEVAPHQKETPEISQIRIADDDNLTTHVGNGGRQVGEEQRLFDDSETPEYMNEIEEPEQEVPQKGEDLRKKQDSASKSVPMQLNFKPQRQQFAPERTSSGEPPSTSHGPSGNTVVLPSVQNNDRLLPPDFEDDIF